MLTVQGSGAAGNPIIIQSDSGLPVNLTAPYWNATRGALYCSGQSYVTFDGNTTGVIQNSANGSLLASQQQSEGIVDNCSNSTVENWTIENIYVHVTANSSDCTSAGNCVDSQCVSINNADHVLVINNVTHDCRVAIGFNLPNSVNYTSWEVSHNTIYNADHGITIGSNASNTSIASVLVHDNEIYNGSNWDSLFASGNCDWHHDGVHVFAQGGSTDILNGVQIFNNYIHGLWTVTNSGSNNGCFNAHIYFEATIINPEIYNNVMELDSGALNSPDGGYVAVRAESTGSGALVANNTFVINNAATSGPGNPVQIVDESGIMMENNLFSGTVQGAVILVQGTTAGTVDYNLYYPIMGKYFWWQKDAFINFSAWQAYGLDTHGLNGSNPMLDSTFRPQSGSFAINAGVNLASLGIMSLNADKLGVQRPSTGNWTLGAYAFGSSNMPPSPPSGLGVSVR